ncbi:unnamed protein product [Phytophthora fragariaefolia]|uniref:Unnamed protein product n=1 Tax=Phytophthora fragariaefolia TaxID=1490495 RepID=A0A9W6XA41_9STRA|nr:unnamed protein product [Phytophthora fragariaefolia]
MSGLADDWTYTTPDGSSHFTGEAAVVAHALTSGLVNENAQDDNAQDLNKQDDTAHHKQDDTMQLKTDENEDAQDEIEENESALHLSASDDDERDAYTSDDDARSSQVDTEVTLTQGTLNTLFGRASDNGDASVPTPDEPSQGAVVRVFGLSQTAPAGQARASGESDDGQIEDDDQEPDREYNELDDGIVSDSDAVEIDEAFITSLMMGACEQDKRAIQARQEAL